MSNTDNQQWRDLAAPSERIGAGKARSQAAIRLEVELRRTLAEYADDTIAGVWVDYVTGRDPLWLGRAGHAEPGDVA